MSSRPACATWKWTSTRRATTRSASAGQAIACDWVVDTSGRAAFLKKRLELEQQNIIRHGSTWCWVDGIVDIERLTGRSRAEIVL